MAFDKRFLKTAEGVTVSPQNVLTYRKYTSR